MAYSKIILNGETLMDVTSDTVDAGNLLNGETATKNSGAKVTGSLTIPVTDVEVNGTSVVDDGVAEVTVPTKVSDLTNDSGYITGYTETDPTVPSWAKQSSKPSYTASEVGAVPTTRKVNGKALSSDITLSASDVSALPSSTSIPTKTSDLTNDSGYITGYTETDPVFAASAAHGITSSDISNWNNKVSDDKTWNGIELDKSVVQMGNNSCRIPFTWDAAGETSAKFIKANKVPTASNVALYDGDAYLKSTTPTSGDNSTKVATTAFVNSSVPTKTSDLTNDSGYITGYTETDPTVPSWAKQTSKPSYTASEVGAVPTSRTVNGKALSSNITLSASDVSALPSSTSIPTKTSDLTNDSGFITGYTETDPTVPAWAKQSTKPSYVASEVGALANTVPAASITSADITNWNRISNIGSFIKLQGSSDVTITLSTSDKYLAMSELVEKQGNAFAHDTTNNCIECLASGIVLVSASIKLYNNFTASDIIGYGLYNDTQSMPFNSAQYRVPANVTAPNQNIMTPAFPISVTVGDKIRIRIRNTTGARGVVQNENTVLSAIYLAPLFT